MRLRLNKGWGDNIKAIEMDDGGVYVVGQKDVTEIKVEPMDLGAYGLCWFRVVCGNTLVSRVNASAVKQVIYAEE